MLAALNASATPGASLVLQLQLGGTRVGCFPPNVPCVHSVSGCASTAAADVASTSNCIVEGGIPITVVGRNLSPTLLSLQNDAIMGALAKAEPTTTVLTIANFTPGVLDPRSPFGTASDTLSTVLPCLYPRSNWGSAISLVSGAATNARSFPMMRFTNDYDTTTRHVCHLAPVIERVRPLAAQQGALITLTGQNFGAWAPQSSANKLQLLGDACFVRIGGARCVNFVKWAATSITFTLCNGAGYDQPVTLVLGDLNSSETSKESAPVISYFVPAPLGEQPTLTAIALRRPGVVFLEFAAPINTFDPLTKMRAWTPQEYVVEYRSTTDDPAFPGECGTGEKRVTVTATNETHAASLPRVNATLRDDAAFGLIGSTAELRVSALKIDAGVPKRMCTEPIAFSVALPAAPPTNVSITLGTIHPVTQMASFLVSFSGSSNFGGPPLDACAYRIEYIEGGATANWNGTWKEVPALPNYVQTELLVGMVANTDYDITVRTVCAVLPPNAHGNYGKLVGAQSALESYIVKPYEEYAAQCAKTGDFSTLVDAVCIKCPTELEGAECILGYLAILEGYWMPQVSLARAVETRNAKKKLFWKCHNPLACSTAPADPTTDGAQAVALTTCRTGYKGNVCAACAENYGPLGTSCLDCPPLVVNFALVGGIVVYLLCTIAWQTYNTYEAAKHRSKLLGAPGTAVVFKIAIDFFQLVGALAFIKIDPPEVVQQLFSIFALGNGVSANAMPAQCLLRWDALGRTAFYIVLGPASMFAPTLAAAIYWIVRWVRSKKPEWSRRVAAWRSRRSDARAGVSVVDVDTDGSDDAAGAAMAAVVPRSSADGASPNDATRVPPRLDDMGAAPRRRRATLVDALSESIAQSDTNGGAAVGPVVAQLRRAFIAGASDSRKDRIQHHEFVALVGERAPSAAFVERMWLQSTNEQSATMDFEQFCLVMKTIDVRRTIVIVVTATVVAVFFNYMKVSTALVEIFMPSNEMNGRVFLKADLDAVAYSPQHITTLVFAGGSIGIFTLGQPLLALGVLTVLHRQKRLADTEVFTMFGFLYAGYKEKYFGWEIMVLFRKIAATFIALVPIGIELQALCAATMLLVLIVLQLILRPFKDERHNVLDCLSMGSIAVKQLCALSYHHIVLNSVNTSESEQLVAFVSWIVTIIVVAVNAALACYYCILFGALKAREMDSTRLVAVTTAQRAWITGTPMERSRMQRIFDYVRRNCRRTCERAAREIDSAKSVPEESSSSLRTRAALGAALDALEQRSAQCGVDLEEHVASTDRDRALKSITDEERRVLLALKSITDEDIDAEGWIVMERQPLTARDTILTALRCGQKKSRVRFNVETHALAPFVADAETLPGDSEDETTTAIDLSFAEPLTFVATNAAHAGPQSAPRDSAHEFRIDFTAASRMSAQSTRNPLRASARFEAFGSQEGKGGGIELSAMQAAAL